MCKQADINKSFNPKVLVPIRQFWQRLRAGHATDDLTAILTEWLLYPAMTTATALNTNPPQTITTTRHPPGRGSPSRISRPAFDS